jgi:NADH-quinone oxidoreductase subunit H
MHWNVLPTLSFFIFLICAFAETNRTPFDLAECERIEWWIPYGIFFDENGFYLFAEYANMFISSTILAVLFFGPTIILEWLGLLKTGVNIANIIGIAALFAKLCFFIFFLYVGVDYSKIQIRSIDAFRMEF